MNGEKKKEKMGNFFKINGGKFFKMNGTIYIQLYEGKEKRRKEKMGTKKEKMRIFSR